LPGLLEGRRHIVLTQDRNWSEDGAEVVHSLEEGLRCANAPHVSGIGGAEIYRLFLHRADRIELTEVNIEAEGDAMLEGFGEGWRETRRERHDAQGERPAYS